MDRDLLDLIEELQDAGLEEHKAIEEAVQIQYNRCPTLDEYDLSE